MRVDGQHHAPAALPPGKTWYPLYRRLGEPRGRSERVQKFSPPPGFDPRTVQHVASSYTDCAIAAPEINIILKMHNTKGKTAMVTPGASSLTVNRVLRIGVNPKTQPSLSSSSPPPSSSSQSSWFSVSISSLPEILMYPQLFRLEPQSSQPQGPITSHKCIPYPRCFKCHPLELLWRQSAALLQLWTVPEFPCLFCTLNSHPQEPATGHYTKPHESSPNCLPSSVIFTLHVFLLPISRSSSRSFAQKFVLIKTLHTEVPHIYFIRLVLFGENYQFWRSPSVLIKTARLGPCGQCWEGAKPKNAITYCNSCSGRNKKNGKTR